MMASPGSTNSQPAQRSCRRSAAPAARPAGGGSAVASRFRPAPPVPAVRWSIPLTRSSVLPGARRRPGRRLWLRNANDAADGPSPWLRPPPMRPESSAFRAASPFFCSASSIAFGRQDPFGQAEDLRVEVLLHLVEARQAGRAGRVRRAVDERLLVRELLGELCRADFTDGMTPNALVNATAGRLRSGTSPGRSPRPGSCSWPRCPSSSVNDSVACSAPLGSGTTVYFRFG